MNTEAKHYFIINPSGFANEGNIIRTNNPDIIEKYINDNTATELTEEEAVNLALYYAVKAYLQNICNNKLDTLNDLEGDSTKELINEFVQNNIINQIFGKFD